MQKSYVGSMRPASAIAAGERMASPDLYGAEMPRRETVGSGPTRRARTRGGPRDALPSMCVVRQVLSSTGNDTSLREETPPRTFPAPLRARTIITSNCWSPGFAGKPR